MNSSIVNVGNCHAELPSMYDDSQPICGCYRNVWRNARGRVKLNSGFESTSNVSSVGRWQSVFEDGTRMMVGTGGRNMIRSDRWSMWCTIFWQIGSRMSAR